MRKNNLVVRRNVRNSKQALVESIMTKIRPIVEGMLINNDVIAHKIDLMNQLYDTDFPNLTDDIFEFYNVTKDLKNFGAIITSDSGEIHNGNDYLEYLFDIVNNYFINNNIRIQIWIDDSFNLSTKQQQSFISHFNAETDGAYSHKEVSDIDDYKQFARELKLFDDKLSRV